MTRRLRARCCGCVLGLGAALAQAACATTYEPRPGRHISAADAGERAFVRDGQRFTLGFFGGGGAEALVAGNDLAIRQARTYRHLRLAGLVACATTVAALTLDAAVLLPRSNDSRAYQTAGIVTLAGSIPAAIACGVLVGESNGALLNAVNIYNDALDGPVGQRAVEPPPPPGGR